MAELDREREQLHEHLEVVRAADALLPAAVELADRLCRSLAAGGKLLTFGNGGSAADAQHFAGELVGRYKANRRPLPAMALSSDPSVVTCTANDFGYEELFARQVVAHVRPGDVVVGYTTSGRSENVVAGLREARQRGAFAVAFTGEDPGPAGEAAELVLAAPSRTTARIQEVHTLLMHIVCERIDAWALEGGADR